MKNSSRQYLSGNLFSYWYVVDTDLRVHIYEGCVGKGQLNSEWIYEVIDFPKLQ